MKQKQLRFKLPLYIRILLGMVLGAIVGMVMLAWGKEQWVLDWVKPWGTLFIRLLQLIAVPLVFLSLLKGITGLKDISRFSKIGVRTICIYLATTLFAIILGVTLATLVQPGALFDRSEATVMQQRYHEVVSEKKMEAEETQLRGPLSFLDDVIPSNFISAAGDNSRMLQVIFFAVLFGTAAIAIPRSKTEPLLKVVESLYEIVLKMIDYVILLAPIGVFALI